ncbi:MMPL family transporter [Anaeromyxobacter oryzisoli]|uniref:hypothetical protein n=1 Tax=Anaeromyxobacter oryzisoli TaxID=2925408 RepID=UPI001F599316|nr:hypothetical protein [Anaeromyxobacter sp. SG63]
MRWLVRFRREALLLAITGVLAWLARGIVLEDDPIRSLTHPDGIRAALFEHYQEKSAFRGKVFVESSDLSEGERGTLATALRAGGYEEVPFLEPPSPKQLLALATLLPAEDARRLTADDALRARAQQVLAVATLPGGDAYMGAVQADPLGMGTTLLGRLAGGGANDGPASGALHVYLSPKPLDYEKVGQVYDVLASLSPRVHFIGGDFFALENYRAVKHDIVVCSTLSLVLTLLVFFALTARWVLLGLLFLGSVVSYLTGVLAIRMFYGEIYAVVLAYTSTFVGFNNESLVHLAGVDLARRDRSVLAIWSAIGTTFIGFVVLLLGRSVMVRQMALASLGGMAGFLAYLYAYRPTLRDARFRGFSWPKLTLRPAAVVAVCIASVVGVVVIGPPRLETHIDAFRYSTPMLDAQVEHFSRRLDALSLENVVAVEARGSPEEALAPLAAAGVVDLRAHPLFAFRGVAEQEETLAVLRRTYPAAAARFRALLEDGGLRLDPAVPIADQARVQDGWDYLRAVGAIGPVRWMDEVSGRRWVFAGLRKGATAPPDAIQLSPRHYYDTLLSSYSRELGWLFLAGLAAMAVYLAWLQRSALRVLYVFAPLFLSTFAFCAYARFTGTTVTIVHVMGASLIIALATDYTAVAVSTDHGEVELSKVLLTGLCTLASFGVLLVARHPVLRDLGAVVTLGCGLALPFALFLRLPPGREGQA